MKNPIFLKNSERYYPGNADILSKLGVKYKDNIVFDIENLQNNQLVFVCARFPNGTVYFWVRDIKISGDEIEGIVDNDLSEKIHKPSINYNDKINFKRENVIAIFKQK